MAASLAAAWVAGAIAVKGTIAFSIAYGLTYAVSAIVLTKIAITLAGKPAQGVGGQGGREQLPPATSNKLPVVYGSAFVKPTIVDAYLTKGQKVMYYVGALTERTDSGTVDFDDPDRPGFPLVYWGDQQIVFDQNDRTRVVGLKDAEGNVDSKVGEYSGMHVYLYGDGTDLPLYGAPNARSLINSVTEDGGLEGVQWSADRKHSKTVFAIIRLVYNQEAGFTGLQQLTFKLNNSLSSPGAVISDYLKNARYGAALATEYVNGDSLAQLDLYSNQGIPYTTNTGTAGTYTRYAINGVIDTTKNTFENFTELCAAADSYPQWDESLGQFGVVVNRSFEDAGQSEADLMHFYSDPVAVRAVNYSWLVSGVAVTPTPLENNYNQVEITFPHAKIKDQTDTAIVDLPLALRNQNEPENKLSLTLPFTNNSVQAQAIATRRLASSRDDLTISFKADAASHAVTAGDVVKVFHNHYGWDGKLFRVIQVNEAVDESLGLHSEITAIEYNPQIYTNFDITEFKESPNSGITDPNLLTQPNAPVVLAQENVAVTPNFKLGVHVPVTGQTIALEVWAHRGTSTPSPTSAFELVKRETYSLAPAYPQNSQQTLTISNLPATGSTESYWFKTRAVGARAKSAFSPLGDPFQWNAVFIPGTSLEAGSITNVQIATNTISENNLGDFAVSQRTIANAAVGRGQMALSAVDAAILADNAVIEAKIADAAITKIKISGRAVDESKIELATITANVIADLAITNTKLGANAVTSAKIAANAVTSSAIAVDAITETKITANAITTPKIAAGAVTGNLIAANTIVANNIAAGTITASKLTLTDFTNLADNPGFELGGAGWSSEQVANTTFLTDSVEALNSTGVMRTTGTGTFAVRNAMKIPVQAGDEFYFEGYVRSTGSAVGYWRVMGHNVSGGETGSADSPTRTGNTWQKTSGTFTVGVGASTIGIEAVHVGGTGNVFFDDATLMRKNGAELIVDGAITTNKLVANAVTADKIAALSVSAEKIQAGAITAQKLAVGAVRAENILVAPKGLNIDPSFATTFTGWTNFENRYFGRDWGSSSEFVAAFKGRDCIWLGDPIRVIPGEQYSMSGWVHPLATGLDVGWLALFYDNNGVVFSAGVPTRANTNQWHYLRGTISIPAGCAYMRCGPWINQPHAGTGVCLFADFEVQRKADAELIVDGSITANKIVAQSLTSTQIASRSITADRITAGSLTSTEIAAGSITADRITAGSLTSTQIASRSISADRIQTNSITANEMQVGTITAASAILADAVITNAKIGDLQVSTVKIGDNAVTVPVGAINSGTVSSNNSEVVIVEASINCSGAQVQLTASSQLVASTSGTNPTGTVTIRVRRNGAIIATYADMIMIAGAGSTRQLAGFTITDFPGAGSFNYQVTMDPNLSGTGTMVASASMSSVFLLETKK